jgi:glycosyltransferase involved in cell wall biosynthesis
LRNVLSGEHPDAGSLRASVLIPTHDHATTLPFTVRSALAQTVRDLEVLIVGDGVTEEVRAVAIELAAADPRVRFLDFEKGPNRGEVNRHTAVTLARGTCIVYLCDDDLLLPEHVADVCTLLEKADLVQCRNGVLDPDGRMHLVAGDLADPRYVEMLLNESRPFNFVGITGTAHTKAFYDAADQPWSTTPAGVYPDHHQWRRLLRAGARGATSYRMTALQFSTHLHGRGDWTPAQRGSEIARWAHDLETSNIQHRVDALVGEAAWHLAVSLLPLESTHRWAAHDLERELDRMHTTLSWRMTAPLRAVRRVFRRPGAER